MSTGPDDHQREQRENPKRFKEKVDRLFSMLPELSKRVIAEYLDMSQQENRDFYDQPDSVENHKPDWHQWGIITHTNKFLEHFKNEIPEYLQRFGLVPEQKLAEQIDGISKQELLEMAVALHDIGKFAVRRKKTEGFTFKGHEKASGQIVRSQTYQKLLGEDFGLTGKQIEYIARCAELHYVLGTLRSEAKLTGRGFTAEYADSAEFKEAAKQIASQYPDFCLEIGIMYLADSMAKMEFRNVKGDDGEILEMLRQKNCDLRLIGAVRQFPINMKVAENYLKERTNVS
jgi:hypothetical protein